MTPQVVKALKSFYQKMEVEKLASLSEIYHQDLLFMDPVHEIKGSASLKNYLENSIKNLNYCNFNFTNELFNEEGGFLVWEMRASHPKIDKGAEIKVPGVTHIKFTTDGLKIREHIDYYDMGALVYEHLPVFGWLTSKVKNRMKNS